MKVSLTTELNQEKVIFIPAFESFSIDNLKKVLNSTLMKSLQALVERKNYKWEKDSVLELTIPCHKETYDVVLFGMDKAEDLQSVEGIQSLFAQFYQLSSKKKMSGFQTIADHLTNNVNQMELIIEKGIQTLIESSYTFDTFKTKKNDYILKSVDFITNYQIDQIQDIIAMGELIGEAVNIAKQLVNEPANELNPRKMAEMAQKTGNAYDFEVKVHDEKKIASFGMEAYISVAKGSENQPRLIIMYHKGNPENPQDIVGLVGKGLTYDSGGYNIKPGDSMQNMKNDMGGAAAVIGAMAAISKAKLPINITAVIAACENMISGRAYRPGDIIGTMAGKTVEITSTDAEGRLTLADAIHYAIKHERVNKIIDVATLTGAAVVALAGVRSAIISNNDDLCNTLLSVEKMANEKFWRLPNDTEYAELNKSEVADLKNTGGRWGGAITAGLFVGEFVQNLPWMHLDIAGSAFCEKPKAWQQKGATGTPVKSLFYFFKELSKSNPAFVKKNKK